MASTLKDVAEKAGVSIRTAGRALRGNGPIRDEVAERVLAVAHSLNYVPNATARNLKQRSCKIVGLIATNTFGAESSQRRIRMFEEAMREAGRYTLLGTIPQDSHELDTLLREWSGLAEYVFFLASWPKSWDPAMLKKYPIHFIFVDCGAQATEFDRLLTDRANGVEAAVTALIHEGAKRIAHVSGITAIGRSYGFEQAINKAGKSIKSFTITCPNLGMQEGYYAGDELVRLRADAAFFDTDRMALGFYRYAHEHGLHIPQDILVAGFDNDSAGSFAIPTLTTVEQPHLETIKAAVGILSREVPSAPVGIVLPTQLIERESSHKTKKT